MNGGKNTIIMVLITFGWLTAILIAKGLFSSSNNYYQLKPTDISKIEQEIRQLQKLKRISSERLGFLYQFNRFSRSKAFQISDGFHDTRSIRKGNLLSRIYVGIFSGHKR